MTGSDQLTALLHTHGPAVVRVILHHAKHVGHVETTIILCNAERGIITTVKSVLPSNRAEAVLTAHFAHVAREDDGDNIMHATFFVSGFRPHGTT